MININILHAKKWFSGLLAIFIVAISFSASAKELKVLNWSEYIGEKTIANFERDTGIKVTLDLTDSWETSEARILSGSSGYDVVFMGSTYFTRQVQAGVWQELDKSKLPNWKNIDPTILKKVNVFDPGNKYMQPWSWYGLEIAYNKTEIDKRFSTKPDSWSFLFEVENAQKISDCGLIWTDAYSDLFAPGLIYAGRDPFSTNPKDYEDVYAKAIQIRPFIRVFSNSYYNHLADGEMCASPSWTGDTDYYTIYGAEKAGVNLVSFIPKEGTYLDYEGLGILSDAKNKEEAYLFLNYVLKPEEAAALTNYIIYPNPVPASLPLINKKIIDSNLIFNPTAEEMKKIHVWPAVYDPAITRLQTRLWTKFKTKI